MKIAVQVTVRDLASRKTHVFTVPLPSEMTTRDVVDCLNRRLKEYGAVVETHTAVRISTFEQVVKVFKVRV